MPECVGRCVGNTWKRALAAVPFRRTSDLDIYAIEVAINGKQRGDRWGLTVKTRSDSVTFGQGHGDNYTQKCLM